MNFNGATSNYFKILWFNKIIKTIIGHLKAPTHYKHRSRATSRP